MNKIVNFKSTFFKQENSKFFYYIATLNKLSSVKIENFLVLYNTLFNTTT